MKKILIYGYGNPGRQDDGLGNLLSDMIDSWAKKESIKSVDTDSNYQLNIEDAYRLNDYDVVVYVDASIEEKVDNFLFEEINPILNPRFSMHSVSPEFVIGLCQEIYGEIPSTYLLHIKGYEWEFMSDITEKANSNLELAFRYLKNKIISIIEA